MYRYLNVETQKWQADAIELAKETVNMKSVMGASQVFVNPKYTEAEPNKRTEAGVNEKFEKELESAVKAASEEMWKSPGTHVGVEPDHMPPLRPGTVVGVDVDMDKGVLSYWVDGKYYGPLREYTGKPVDLKGKKLVPAVSIYGRRVG